MLELKGTVKYYAGIIETLLSTNDGTKVVRTDITTRTKPRTPSLKTSPSGTMAFSFSIAAHATRGESTHQYKKFQ
jgi:hypothetical protein